MLEFVVLQIDRAGLFLLASFLAWLSISLWRKNGRAVHLWAAGAWGSFAIWRLLALIAWTIPGAWSGWEHRYHISIPQTAMLLFMIGLVWKLLEMRAEAK